MFLVSISNNDTKNVTAYALSSSLFILGNWNSRAMFTLGSAGIGRDLCADRQAERVRYCVVPDPAQDPALLKTIRSVFIFEPVYPDGDPSVPRYSIVALQHAVTIQGKMS